MCGSEEMWGVFLLSGQVNWPGNGTVFPGNPKGTSEIYVHKFKVRKVHIIVCTYVF